MAKFLKAKGGAALKAHLPLQKSNIDTKNDHIFKGVHRFQTFPRPIILGLHSYFFWGCIPLQNLIISEIQDPKLAGKIVGIPVSVNKAQEPPCNVALFTICFLNKQGGKVRPVACMYGKN